MQKGERRGAKPHVPHLPCILATFCVFVVFCCASDWKGSCTRCTSVCVCVTVCVSVFCCCFHVGVSQVIALLSCVMLILLQYAKSVVKIMTNLHSCRRRFLCHARNKCTHTHTRAALAEHAATPKRCGCLYATRLSSAKSGRVRKRYKTYSHALRVCVCV